MKVLLICDDIWHPAEVIKMGLESWKQEKYEFDVIMTAKDILTPELLREYPVVINAKGNAVNAANCAPWFEEGVTEAGPEEFKKYVEEGGGFLSLHAGNTFMEESCAGYCNFVGNSYKTHPLRCPVTVRPVRNHAVTKGVCEYTERDEQYVLKILAEDIDVFLEAETAEEGKQVAGYTRMLGKGRVCVLTPGHTLAVWKNAEFRKLLSNAIDWCAGQGFCNGISGTVN